MFIHLLVFGGEILFGRKKDLAEVEKNSLIVRKCKNSREAYFLEQCTIINVCEKGKYFGQNVNLKNQ